MLRLGGKKETVGNKRPSKVVLRGGLQDWEKKGGKKKARKSDTDEVETVQGGKWGPKRSLKGRSESWGNRLLKYNSCQSRAQE